MNTKRMALELDEAARSCYFIARDGQGWLQWNQNISWKGLRFHFSALEAGLEAAGQPRACVSGWGADSPLCCPGLGPLAFNSGAPILLCQGSLAASGVWDRDALMAAPLPAHPTWAASCSSLTSAARCPPYGKGGKDRGIPIHTGLESGRNMKGAGKCS